jgi:hypothetical protein
VRFLITDGRQQTPVHPVGGGNILKNRQQRRQTLSDLLEKLEHANAVQPLLGLVEAVIDRLQLSAAPGLRHEGVSCLHQAVICAGRKGPGVGQGTRQAKRRGH